MIYTYTLLLYPRTHTPRKESRETFSHEALKAVEAWQPKQFLIMSVLERKGGKREGKSVRVLRFGDHKTTLRGNETHDPWPRDGMYMEGV